MLDMLYERDLLKDETTKVAPTCLVSTHKIAKNGMGRIYPSPPFFVFFTLADFRYSQQFSATPSRFSA